MNTPARIYAWPIKPRKPEAGGVAPETCGFPDTGTGGL